MSPTYVVEAPAILVGAFCVGTPSFLRAGESRPEVSRRFGGFMRPAGAFFIAKIHRGRMAEDLLPAWEH